MILERKETNKVKPMTNPAYYLEWFQAVAQKEFRQSPAVSQFQRELGTRKSPHIQGSQGRVSERAAHRKDSEICTVPSSLQLNRDECMCNRKSPKAWERILQKF